MDPKLNRVDQIIDGYGANKEKLVQILLDVQDEQRWLPKDVLHRVSQRLEVPLAYVYNVATFYKHFSLVPKGRHSLAVCVGTACHVRGAEKLVDRVTQAVGVKPGDTTRDEKFSVTTVNCLGCCALGPVMVADEEYLTNPTAKQLEDLVERAD
ncbi:MAG: NADH-quinone oxidoreductase subunit NuoE family protein [Deferrisomatales bacterium]